MSTEIPEFTEFQKPVQIGEFPESANVRYAEDKTSDISSNLRYDTVSSHAETATLEQVYDSQTSILLKEKPSPSFANFPQAPSGLPIGVFKTNISNNIGDRTSLENTQERIEEIISKQPLDTNSTIVNAAVSDLLSKQTDMELIYDKMREFTRG